MPDHRSSAEVIVLPARTEPHRELRRGPAGVLPWVLDILLTWQERARERRRLLMLDDRLLRDIGLSRADVEREAALPFWRR